MNLFDLLISSTLQQNREEITFNKDSQEVQRDNRQVPDGSWVISWFLTSQFLPLTAKITMQAAATRVSLPLLWLCSAKSSQVETHLRLGEGVATL